MDLTTIKEKIAGTPAKIKGIFAGIFSTVQKPRGVKIQAPDFSRLPEKIKSLFLTAPSFVSGFLQNSLSRVPEKKRRPLLIGIAGLLGLALVLLIAGRAIGGGRGQSSSLQTVARGFSIPFEELFIPAEPDFVPMFLLEREPRRNWTLEDVRPYWRPPENSERWREEIKSAVDKLMEGVP